MSEKERVEKTTDYMEYVFSEEEIKDLSTALALATIEAKRLDDEIKSLSADYKGKIKKEEMLISAAARKIKEGKEMRNIAVEKRIKGDTVFYARLDTGEIYRTRSIQDEERQMKLFQDE